MNGHDMVTKESVLRNMRRVGLADRVAEADRVLPDPVDLRRDDRLLARLGVSRESLMDALGGSP